MQNIWLVMEELPQTMATEIAHHGAAFGFGIGLDRVADITRRSTRFNRRNAAHQAFISDVDQSFGAARHFAHAIHAA